MLIVYFVWNEMIAVSMSIGLQSMSIVRFLDVILLSSALLLFSRLTIWIWEARQLNSARLMYFSRFLFQDLPFRFRKSSSL